MISRFLARQVLSQQRLFKFRKAEQYLQPKRSNWIDTPKQTLSYRHLQDIKQDDSDWYGSAFMMSLVAGCTLINMYMYWDEIKLQDPPGVYGDLSVHKNEDLGVPSDDQFGYAPLKKELLESGKVLDLGNSMRNENREVFHLYMVRHNLPNKYDV